MNAILRRLSNLKGTEQCAQQLAGYYHLYKSKSFEVMNQYDSLASHGYKALAMAETKQDTLVQIEALKQIVYVHTRMKENTKRWNYVQIAKKLILAFENYPSVAANYRWLGYQFENQYTKTKDISILDSTEIYIQKAKTLALSNQYHDELTRIYRALEAISYHRGNLVAALANIDSAIFYSKKVEGKINVSGLYLSKAWDHFDLKQFKAAEIYTDSMLYYDDGSDLVGNMMTLSQAAELYEGVGNTAKAFKSYKKYSSIKDSIFTKDRLFAINELEKKYEVEKKEKELLVSENRITQLSIALTVLITVAILVFLWFKQQQLRKERELNQKLQVSITKRAILERQVTKARENIAQDFHDEMGNKLARINLLSNLLQDELQHTTKAKSKIEQITDDAKALYFGTRDFIFSLKSNSDCLDEVVTYLSDFGEDYFSKSEVRFVLKQEIETNVKLPFYWSKQLVFIFKEAMTNTMKHAKCTTAHLSFYYKNRELTIVFEDNGVGIPEQKLKSTNGLHNMRQRAKKIQGELIIASEEAQGTTIVFKGKTTSKGGTC